ncbi:FecR family protein [bacterium A37T11]|nr:FecR family protein [bacterium A37T11]
MDQENDIQARYQRFLDNRATAAEVRELMTQFGTTDPVQLQKLVKQALGTAIDNRPLDDGGEQAILQIHDRLKKKLFPAPKHFLIRLLPYAAAISLIGAGIYLYIINRQQAGSLSSSFTKRKVTTTEIRPGFNQATLTLADGAKVSLDSTKNGIKVTAGQTVYNDGTSLKAPVANSSSIIYNALTTPKGGQYQIILDDGTKVWLNAATTLTYPSHFGKTREVSLTGEAFFSIANDTDKPFTVKSQNQVIRVLGTSFNLSSYADEKEIKTTLVSGAVRISTLNPSTNGSMDSQLLKPGQQAINAMGKILVKSVNVDNETAWRDGVFSFQGKSFSQIMRELSRWYNLEVVYEGDPPVNTYFGSAFRDDKLSVILGLLKSSNIKYRFEEGKLVISTLKREGAPELGHK